MNWNTPTVRRVPVATDPSCATLGQCTAGRCTELLPSGTIDGRPRKDRDVIQFVR